MVLQGEIGRTIAQATLVAGTPRSFVDVDGVRKAYRWELPAYGLGPRCLYTLYAEREGSPQSLAAWRVVGIEPPHLGADL